LKFSFTQYKGRTQNSSPILKAWSQPCLEFLNERMRWYPNGKKIIPKNLVLNPVVLAHWYMGDGSVSVPKGRLQVRLHTNGFMDSDVTFLIKMMHKQFGLQGFITHWRGQPIITFQHKNASKFISLVKPFLVPSFIYKAPNNPWVPPRCQKCGETITGLLGTRRYVKYCDLCASPGVMKFRSLNRHQRDQINIKKKIARWKTEGRI